MLIDSNILIYAINRSSPKHKRAQQFLQENVRELEIAHQNILETLRVLTHKKFPSPMKPDDAVQAVERIINICRVVYPEYRTYHIALNLIRKHKLSADAIFDAYLVATSLVNGIMKIATDNVKDFQRFEEIRVVNPFTT